MMTIPSQLLRVLDVYEVRLVISSHVDPISYANLVRATGCTVDTATNDVTKNVARMLFGGDHVSHLFVRSILVIGQDIETLRSLVDPTRPLWHECMLRRTLRLSLTFLINSMDMARFRSFSPQETSTAAGVIRVTFAQLVEKHIAMYTGKGFGAKVAYYQRQDNILQLCNSRATGPPYLEEHDEKLPYVYVDENKVVNGTALKSVWSTPNETNAKVIRVLTGDFDIDDDKDMMGFEISKE